MVESYYNAELTDVIFDIDAKDEWRDVAKELGLVNQLSFISMSKSPNPYPYMNKSMTNVFEALCPVVVEFDRYNKTPIPLEVLKQIKFCIQENYFSKIYIQYDDKTPDPIVVGNTVKYAVYYYPNGDKSKSSAKTEYIFNTEKEAKEYVENNGHTLHFATSESNNYLIARWGDELRPYKELVELAKTRLVDKYSNDYLKTIKELQNRLGSVKELVTSYLNGEITQYDLSKNC